MFAAIDNLGKSNTINATSFRPTPKPAIDITFKPVQNPAGNMNFVPIVETDDESISKINTKGLLVSELNKKEPLTMLSPESIDEDDEDKNPDLFSLGDDPIKTFYIGSITVVGLFILYRMLTKKG